MFDQLIREAGWQNDDQAATGLGIDPGIISRLRARKTSPSALTIDAIITRLGVPYSALFVRVEAGRD